MIGQDKYLKERGVIKGVNGCKEGLKRDFLFTSLI